VPFAIIVYARDQKFDYIALWVLDENQRSQSFYTRMSFLSDGASKSVEFSDVTLEESQFRSATILGE